MMRVVGFLTAASLFFGSPAVALSCASTNQKCCCTHAGKSSSRPCPMVKATPSPVSAILSNGISVVPVLRSTPRVDVAALASADAKRFVWMHEAQAPPDRAAFRSPSSLRGPPSLLA